MPKTSNQKRRILVLLDIFQRETDQAHQLSMSQILLKLKQHNIEADRRSIYDDIAVLNDCGYDIVSEKSATTSYYLADRGFELGEIRYLIDSVTASKCLTKSTTARLVKKLKTLCSTHDAKHVAGEVRFNYVKCENQQVVMNIEKIHEAIRAKRNITFKYRQYTITKKLDYRRKGKRYTSITPYAIYYHEDTYYLIACDDKSKKFKHYRIDRMTDAELGRDVQYGKEELPQIRIEDYPKHTFSMFGGAVENVTIQFDIRLINVIIDRFNLDAPISKGTNGQYRVTVPVALSPQFYSWIFGFQGDMQILSPPNALEDIRKMLIDVSKMHQVMDS